MCLQYCCVKLCLKKFIIFFLFNKNPLFDILTQSPCVGVLPVIIPAAPTVEMTVLTLIVKKTPSNVRKLQK